jgi:hypothetical protein
LVFSEGVGCCAKVTARSLRLAESRTTTFDVCVGNHSRCLKRAKSNCRGNSHKLPDYLRKRFILGQSLTNFKPSLTIQN